MTEKKSSPDEDDEITIDFSKITRIFSGKKEDKKGVNVSEKEEKGHPVPQQHQHEKKETEDDDVAIDLSGIKKFFSKLKEEEKETTNKTKHSEDHQKREKEDDEEDLSLNMGTIKHYFSDLKASFTKKEETKKEDEDTLDVKSQLASAATFVSKHKEVLTVLILILIALSTSIYLRAMPIYLPATDSWAESSLHTQIQNQIAKQVAQDYPNLPATNRNQIAEAEFNKFVQANKAQIENEKRNIAAFYKAQLQNDLGHTYLLELDPYFWMRMTENVLDHGYPGDEKRNGIEFDNHMLAPLGREIYPDTFHVYFETYLYKFVRLFNKDAELMAVVFIVPIILGALAIIPAFFIARRIGGNFAGFIAAFIVAIHPAFLTRTVGGFSDTDGYNLLFPLIITWLFLEAFETKRVRHKILLSGLAGFFLGIYSKAWGGWWYIFDFLLATSIAYLFYYFLIHIKEIKSISIIWKHQAIKETLLLISVFFISSLIFVTFFFNFYNFKQAPLQPFGFIAIKDVATTTVWPNVFTTVAEQNEASYDQIINQIGGSFLFILSIIGILLTLFKKDIRGRRDIKVTILLAVWFIATIFASTKGIRWTLLLVPAFAIGLGVFVGIAFDYLKKWFHQELHINQWVSGIGLALLFLLLVGVTPIPPFCSIGMCQSAVNVARAETPSMNDAWYNSLQRIKESSQENAIITSWWDFGHWFKSIADRPVTFDGTTQGTPMAHWVGKALLTPDENVSVGILRMLDCGSELGFDTLDSYIQKPYLSVAILNDIAVVGKDQAKKILKTYDLRDDQIENVTQYTHCEPPEAFVITSEDMIGKSGVWGHFGAWNFERATMVNHVRNMEETEAVAYLQKEFNVSQENAQQMVSEIKGLGVGREANDWIAPWPSYASQIEPCDHISNSTYRCPFSQSFVEININNMTTAIQTKEGTKTLAALSIGGNESIRYQEYEDSIDFGMILIPTEEGYSRVIASKEQVNSMFTRLFFLDGVGLHHFKKFSDERSVFGNHIIIWKVDWDGKDDLNSTITSRNTTVEN